MWCCCGWLSWRRRLGEEGEDSGEEVEGAARSLQLSVTDKAAWRRCPASQEYDVFAEIGNGAFSKVLLGRHKETGAQVALKVVFRNRDGMRTEHWNILRSEMVALKKCEHPNIVSLVDQYEDSEMFVLVLELLAGGEMLEHIQEIKHYTERQAAILFAQIISAVAHMHSMGYMHRDLKPENILFVHSPKDASDEELIVKVIDLGMSTVYNPQHPIRAAMGTAGFLAPECCHRVPHTPAMDIWSLGVMLFVMLCGRMPYSHEQIENLYYPEIDIRRSPGYKSARFKSLSQPARELLLGMLDRDPRQRVTADEVLDSAWLSQLLGAAIQPQPLVAGVTSGASSVSNRRTAMGMASSTIVDSGTSPDGVHIELSDDSPTWKPKHPKGLNRKALEKHVELDADAFKKKEISAKKSLGLAKEDMIASMKDFSENFSTIMGKKMRSRNVSRESSAELLVRLAPSADPKIADPLMATATTTATITAAVNDNATAANDKAAAAAAAAAAASGGEGGEFDREDQAQSELSRSEYARSDATTAPNKSQNDLAALSNGWDDLDLM